MGVRITFSIEGETQLAAELGIAGTGIKDFSVPLGQVRDELLKTWQLNFDSRGGLLADGWAERKPRYRGGTRIDTWPLLEKTGKMRGSFYGDIQGDSVVLGNTSPYFKYHQSNQPRTKLPRRLMMKIDETRRNFIIKAFQSHIVNITRNLKK